MSFQPKQQKNWYSSTSTPGSGFAERKETIARYRSPHTIADEIYRILTWGVQPLLMVFCMALSFSSYQAYFGHNFSPLFATAGAVILSLVIEMCKIKIGGYVFQVPFLSGVNVLKSSFPAFSVWFGAVLLTIATFIMSVNNSTTGASMLAKMTGFQKNEVVFQPNTTEIDNQISQANDRITSAKEVKWRGTVTYQAQQSMKADSKTISKLQDQKDEAIKQQRSDFERRRAQMDTNTNSGAEILMASGGWVEVLQGLTLFLIAACMATIDKMVANQSQNQPKQTGFEGHTEATTAKQTGFEDFTRKPNQFNNDLQSRPKMGFYTNNPFRDTVPQHQNTVPQYENAVAQQSGVIGSDQILKHLKAKLQSEIPNLHNPQASKATVYGRIEKVLDDTFMAMWNRQFLPSRDLAIKVYQYLGDTAFPALNNAGYPYQKDAFVMKALSDVIERIPVEA